MRKLLLAAVLMLIGIGMHAQVTISGVVKDAVTNEPLTGATIYIAEIGEGTFSLLNGEFDLPVDAGEYLVNISYIGFITVEKKVSAQSDINLGTIKLESDAVGLNEVKIIADVAIGRETPVAVSTINQREIQEKLGNQEFPEIMKTTPGTYATKTGGGFGDSRINIRGFDARNTATLINGVPVNDMENGWIYWSNWAGLADVTRTMQIQRGLGASKLAIPSLGGTINILTKTTDAEKGGNLSFYSGNNNYLKYGATFSTGLSENGFASTISLAKTTGDGYVDGTQFESYSYYINISKRINDNQHLSLSLFGAPQWHGQSRTKHSIEFYQTNTRGKLYNSDWGYKGGEIYYENKNFYHKPQAILNHFWTIDEKTQLMTAVYASIGTGGGTGGYGDDKYFNDYQIDGQIDYDSYVAENELRAHQGASTIMRASMNNHAWYGILSNFKKELTDEIKLSAGVDARYYKGEHYREVTDLLGGEFFLDDGKDLNNYNKIVKEGDKIDYHNDGLVSWGGGYVTGEYSTGNLSAFLSGSASLKGYKRIDYFNYFTEDNIAEINNNADTYNEYLGLIGDTAKFERALEGQESDWQNFFGYVIKGGANYNVTEKMNAFLNVGFFERQPDFDAVFLNYINYVNEEAKNEKTLSFELGYGYQDRYIKAQANYFYTLWQDKSFTPSFAVRNESGEIIDYNTANILGVDALHQGFEIEATIRPIQKLEIFAMGSFGSYKWKNDVENVYVFDDEQNPVDTINVYIKDVHVGDAAQTTIALAASYELIPNFKVGVTFMHFDNLFASFDPIDRSDEIEGGNPDSWQLPSYQTLDARLSYDFKIGELKSVLYAKFNNILDAEYIAEAEDGDEHDWSSSRVYYGLGRTWSMGVKINF